MIQSFWYLLLKHNFISSCIRVRHFGERKNTGDNLYSFLYQSVSIEILSPTIIGALHTSLRSILKSALKAEGDSFSKEHPRSWSGASGSLWLGRCSPNQASELKGSIAEPEASVLTLASCPEWLDWISGGADQWWLGWAMIRRPSLGCLRPVNHHSKQEIQQRRAPEVR